MFLPFRRIGRGAAAHHRYTPGNDHCTLHSTAPRGAGAGLAALGRRRFPCGLQRLRSCDRTTEGLTGRVAEPLHSLGEVPPVAEGEVERVAQSTPLLVVRDHD